MQKKKQIQSIGQLARPLQENTTGQRSLSKRDQAVTSARQNITAGNFMGAYKLLEPYIKRRKPDAEVLYLAGFIAETSGDFVSAVRYGEKSLAVAEHAETLLLLARSRRALGETSGCVKLCNRTLKREPQNQHAKIIKAGAMEAAGRIDEAESLLSVMMGELNEHNQILPAPLLIEWSKVLVQRKRYPEAIKEIDNLLGLQSKNNRGDTHNFRALQYLKAKACDRQHDFTGAFAAAQAANALAEVEYSPEVYEQQLEILIKNWSQESMASFPVSKCNSELPVFVAGMPRSGTSLIDQIIDAHPKAAGVGELESIEKFAIQLSQAWNPELSPPECFGSFQEKSWTRVANTYTQEIKRLSPSGAERVVNKALSNNRLVGLLAKLFPRTRIIHAIRDPRDVAISCFMGGFNQHTLAWTHQFEHIVHAWEQSLRIMRYWQKTLDIPILEVRYENLVTEPEKEFPRIIEFLGLEWDDACLKFHQSQRTVRTLSYDQVNHPLYTSSIGRHQHYAQWLSGIEFPDY